MQILTENDKKAYKEFLENNERCNFQQSIEWGKVKQAWKNEIVLSKNENNEIVGAISVLIRKIPIFGNFMYVSRGPICDIHDEKVLKELAKKYKAFTLKWEPDIKSDDLEFRKIAINLGFKIKDDAKDFSEGIQPRYVFRLDLKGKTEEEAEQELKELTKVMEEQAKM